MVREKTGDDSDPDEFDFELPTPKSENNTNKQVTFKDTETEAKKEPRYQDPKFWDARDLCFIYLKFKQRGQTLGYFVKMMQME